MAVTRDSSKVLVGYANIYVGDVDTALPANTVELGGDWGVSWNSIGYTMDGLELEFERDTDDVNVEESITPVKVVVNSASMSVRFELAEDTLENMKLAYGGGTLNTTAAATGIPGSKELILSPDIDEMALGFEAENSYGFYRRVYLPRVMAVGSVETQYKRGEARTYAVEFRALGDIGDITIVEKTAPAV